MKNINKNLVGVALTVLAIILFFNIGMLTAQSPGWLSGWSYRTAVTIQEKSGSTLTDYQVKIPVNYTTGMNSNFSDLRFTGSDGTTLLSYWVEGYTAGVSAMLSYWVEGYTAGVSATVWVKVNLTANTNKTIYMYYGNVGATSKSNGTTTFDFFDDFEGVGLDTSKWIMDNGNVIVASSEVILDNTDQMRNNVLRSKPISMRAKVYENASGYWIFGLSSSAGAEWSSNSVLFQPYTNLKSYPTSYKDGVYSQNNVHTYTAGYHIWDIIWRLDEAKYYYDGSLAATFTSNVPTVDLYHKYDNRNGVHKVDWTLLRKYASVEPTVTFVPSNHAPTIVNAELYPSSPRDTEDLTLNMRCSDLDGDTLTAYWSCYKNTVKQTQYSGSGTIPDGIDTNVEIISNLDTTVGDQWYCQAYCSDGTDNSTTKTTSTRTIQPEPTCSLGGNCSSCTGWVTMDTSHASCTGDLNGCVRDGNGNSRYDQVCCSGFLFFSFFFLTFLFMYFK